MQNSQVGDLLVASTLVDGTVLNQSVCLLVHEDDGTAIGLLLNRPLQLMVASEAAQSGQSKASNRLFQVDGEEAGEKVGEDKPPHLHKQIITVVGPADDPQAGAMLMGQSLHFGGPLSGPVVAVHGTAELGEAEAGEGIFVAAQRDHLEALLQTEQKHPYRLIVGHLGWTQTQLNNEIEQGVWHRMPATADILWTEDGLLWPALIRKATSHSLSRWLGVEHLAGSTELN